MKNNYREVLETLGMTIIDEKINERISIITAIINTKRGKFIAYVGTNGCAQFSKPNGTSKMYYQCSAPKIHMYAKKVIDDNN